MIGLVVILACVFFLPFTVKKVEHNLEIFLFLMGLAATWISGVLDQTLLMKAVNDPVKITVAVLLSGLLCRWLHSPLEKSILTMSRLLTPRIFFAVTVVLLGLISSVITAIIAAIVLVMIVNILPLDRRSEIQFTILACFSIGLGAALTPIGEPLSTITISKLNQDFFYLLKLIGPEIIPALVVFALLTLVFVKPHSVNKHRERQQVESYKEIFIRAIKIYFFVMGLTFLGNGFQPLINEYVIGLHPILLYWINMISAILDNATLAAAEISPAMGPNTVQAVLLGLIVSGGMLIPGNIPNIIAAGKLNITSKEWASFGIPIGLITMTAYFLVLFVLNL